MKPGAVNARPYLIQKKSHCIKIHRVLFFNKLSPRLLTGLFEGVKLRNEKIFIKAGLFSQTYRLENHRTGISISRSPILSIKGATMHRETKTEDHKKARTRAKNNRPTPFELSRQAALACLEKFPNAQVCYRGRAKNLKLKWTPLTVSQVRNTSPGYFAVILNTISSKISCIDFDRRGPAHLKGGHFRVIKALYTAWIGDDYPFQQETPNGGCHALYKFLDKTIKSGSNKAGQGVDFKTGRNLFMLYDPRIWKQDFNKIKQVPPGFFKRMERVQKIGKWLTKNYGKGKGKTAGAGKTNEHLNSGFGTFANSSIAFKIVDKAFNIALEHLKSPGNTDLKTAKQKLARSLKDGLKQNINLKPDPKIDYDRDPKAFRDYLVKLKDSLLLKAKKDKPDCSLPKDFHDPQKVLAENNFFLLAGDTQAGKTAHSLNRLQTLLNNGLECLIWEHSETNRWNRLNAWLKDTKPKKRPYMSEKRMDIIQNLKPGCVLLIDDTDSFLQIKNPTARREVADSIEVLSWICQLLPMTTIACHYQTKTSKGEKQLKLRAGGDMSWINKTRYFGIIETAEIDKDGKKEIKSFFSIEKGDRPKDIKEKAWWLKPDYSLGDPIAEDKVKEIMEEKLSGGNTSPAMAKKIIEDFFTDVGADRMPMKDYYHLCKENLGIGRDWAYKLFRKLDKDYQTSEEGRRRDKKVVIVRAFPGSTG